MRDPYWNHNVHYHPVVLAAVPDGCRTVLDAGCGDGLLARKLATRAASVTGVDRCPEMIRLAREERPGNVTFLQGDYLRAARMPLPAPAPVALPNTCSVLRPSGWRRRASLP